MVKHICSVLKPRPVDLDEPVLYLLTCDPDLVFAPNKTHGPRTPMYMLLQLILRRAAIDKANAIQFSVDSYNDVVRILEFLPGPGVPCDHEYWRKLMGDSERHGSRNQEPSEKNGPNDNGKLVRYHIPNLVEMRPMRLELFPKLLAEFRWMARLPRPFSKGSLAISFGGKTRRPRLRIRTNEVLVSYSDRPSLCSELFNALNRKCSCQAIHDEPMDDLE